MPAHHRSRPRSSRKRSSDDVPRRSNVLDIEESVITKTDPKSIAGSLKRAKDALLRLYGRAPGNLIRARKVGNRGGTS